MTNAFTILLQDKIFAAQPKFYKVCQLMNLFIKRTMRHGRPKAESKSPRSYRAASNHLSNMLRELAM